jgi:TolB-like protein
MSEAEQTAVREEMERILGSRALNGSDQLKRLLRLVVTRTLNGQSGLLKEYNLGLEVFQRPPDYDPKVDPIVRVQARRLRTKLDEYYAGEGAEAQLVIRIPKGAYVPSFDKLELPVQPPVPRKRWLVAWAGGVLLLLVVAVWVVPRWTARDRPSETDIRRSVAVLPLEAFNQRDNRDRVADEIAEVLTTELGKSGDLRVVSRTSVSRYRQTSLDLPAIARQLHVRWVVEGGVGAGAGRTYVKLRAIDSSTDRKVWADVFDFTPNDLVAVNTRAAGVIAAAIAAEIRRQESPDSKR